MKVWVVAFSDNDECYMGETAICEDEQSARKVFEQRKEDVRCDFADKVDHFDEDKYNFEGYADKFKNDTVCSLSMFSRELNGKWQGNLDW